MLDVVTKWGWAMADRVKSAPRNRSVEEAKCQHYWIIETPSGPKSRGVCKNCGATKEFDNYWPYSTWERDAPRLLELPIMPDVQSDELNDS